MSSSSSEVNARGGVKHDTTLVWAKMVGYARADGYFSRGKNCGSCAHYNKKAAIRVGGFVGLGDCALHDFIPFTSAMNVCDSHETPEPEE